MRRWHICGAMGILSSLPNHDGYNISIKAFIPKILNKHSQLVTMGTGGEESCFETTMQTVM